MIILFLGLTCKVPLNRKESIVGFIVKDFDKIFSQLSMDIGYKLTELLGLLH